MNPIQRRTWWIFHGAIILLSFASVLPAQTSLDHLYRDFSDVTNGRLKGVNGIAPDETLELGEIEGPAIIRHVWFTVQSPVPEVYGLLVLRVYWDDETEPSIEVPLGDFFGVGFGEEVLFKSYPFEMIPAGGATERAAVNCYLPMPFREKVRITVENRGARMVSSLFYQVDFENQPDLPADTMYLHASWRRENPVTRGEPFEVFFAQGKGRYIGTVFNYHILEEGSWVEGGENFYIDGDEDPTIPGIGSEDYFGQSWGYRFQENGLFHGTSFGPEGNRMTAYRFHLLDPIHFNRSIRMEMRCHGAGVGDRADDYSAVAYWYQLEPHQPFDPLPPLDYNYVEVSKENQTAWWDKTIDIPEEYRPGGLNISPGAERVSSSGGLGEEYSAKKALDGDLSTKWAEIMNPHEHWLAVDFGRPRRLTGFVMKNASLADELEGYNVQSFHIDISKETGAGWTTVMNSDDQNIYTTENREVYAVRLREPVMARLVRLYVTDAGKLDQTVRLPEFEIYASD